MDMRASIGSSPAKRGPNLTLHGEERWFVVRTQPHRETKAAQQLANQNYRMFLPRFLKSRRHARKFETIVGEASMAPMESTGS
jgi:hypothetical protein